MKDERKKQIVTTYLIDKIFGAFIPIIMIVISDWFILDHSVLASRLVNISAIILIVSFNFASYFGMMKFFNNVDADKKNKTEEEL